MSSLKLKFKLQSLLLCFIITIWLKGVSGEANSLDRTLIGAIDAWDAKNPSYNLLGGWMTLKKTNNIMAQQEMGVQRANEDFLGRISRFLSSHQVEMKFPSAKILGGKNYISTKHFVC